MGQSKKPNKVLMSDISSPEIFDFDDDEHYIMAKWLEEELGYINREFYYIDKWLRKQSNNGKN